MVSPSYIVRIIILSVAWFPIYSLAAPADYDGSWAGTYSCGAVLTDPSRPEFSNETKLSVANGRVSGEFTRNTKLGKEVENWIGSIDNGKLNFGNSVQREDGATWSLRFSGSISGNDKFSIGGEMLARTGQKVRDCKLAISLIAPSQASLIGKAKTAEENQARQKQTIDSEKKQVAADKESLAAQVRKVDADKATALKQQAQIAVSNKLLVEKQAKLIADKEQALAAQARKVEADKAAALKEQEEMAATNKLLVEQQAKLVAEKEVELAAEAQKIEDEKAAANEVQAQIAEKNRLLVEQQAKLVAEKEKAAKESSSYIQFLLFALGCLLLTGFVIFLAVRRKGDADHKQKEPTAAAVEVMDDTNLAQEVKAEKERQELALLEQVATLEKEKNALIERERVAALEAQKEAALYQAQIEKLDQERMTAIDIDKKEREKTSEALRIASAEARISIPLTVTQSSTEKEKLEDSKSTSSFCMQCGTKLEDKATACSSCGNPVPFTSSLINKKLVDDAKNKLQNFSSQLQGAVVKAAGDISKEARKINEARIQAAGQSNFKEAENKRTALVNAGLSFWSNLSSNQKIAILGIAFLMLILPMFIYYLNKPTIIDTPNTLKHQSLNCISLEYSLALKRRYDSCQEIYDSKKIQCNRLSGMAINDCINPAANAYLYCNQNARDLPCSPN